MNPNPNKLHFVSRPDARRLLKACLNTQWRLLFALSRFDGLRCPSEHLRLRWGDIDWDNGSITVTSPKTEHPPGGASRVIPLFPELRPHRKAAFHEAEPGTEFVITGQRISGINLRTHRLRIIRRIGLNPWPK